LRLELLADAADLGHWARPAVDGAPSGGSDPWRPDRPRAHSGRRTSPCLEPIVPVMTPRHPERLGAADRLRNSREFVAVQTGGTLFRGRCALLIVLPRPGEPTRVGFVASKRGVGGAVQRNRARRRLREIVRRRWSRIAADGYWFVFIASRAALDAPHERIAGEVESLLAGAGLLTPVGEAH